MSDFDNTQAIKPNKKFKDTIFRYIFSNSDKFSELYEAISGKHLSNEEIEEANLYNQKQTYNYFIGTAVISMCKYVS